ncbi:MAG: IclR family transcriptional regulator [Victivallaceae bacterium]|nr:IclR family transcriptional regulator C-terminal domain-containing protein [Victivallaceae bacterium]
MNNTIPAVEKTVHLMRALARKKSSQAELSKELDIAMSTTYRILSTLRKHDWVRKNETGEYSLSGGLMPLLNHFRSELARLDHAKGVVSRISSKYGIACKLSIRRDDEQLTLFRAEPPGPIALTGQSGSTFPLIEGSVGAALLCAESEEMLETLVDECAADIPEKLDPSLLYGAIGEIRSKGYALNLRKNRWNIAAMSMPVFGEDRGSVVAALTLIGNTEEFESAKAGKLAAILRDAIDECQTEESSNQGDSK